MEEKYNIEDLQVGLVECFKNGKIVTEMHTLFETSYADVMYDLDLCKTVDVDGEKEIYYPKSLISYEFLLSNSRINWKFVNREDALKIKYFLADKYMKFLRIKRVNLTRKIQK